MVSGTISTNLNIASFAPVAKYWFKDNLGSPLAEYPHSATQESQFTTLSFDPWGLRRKAFGAGANAASNNGFINVSGADLDSYASPRGYTGHEHLDEVGLIHMNGRIYDPIIGRFLQVDPVISEPYNIQSYNGYSYVLNNPLSYTDPTGYSAWTEVRRPVAAVAVAAIMVYTGTIAFAGSFNPGALTLGQKLTVAAASGFASGGVAGGNLESAFKGALTAVLFAGVGNLHLGGLEAVAAHAVVGCVSAGLSDGSCGKGALAAGFAKGVGAPLTIDNLAVDTITHAVLGGIGSSIAGGKFANGAVTGAFGYLFNRVISGCSDCRPDDRRNMNSGFSREHQYGVLESAPLGYKDDPYAWMAASITIHSWSAPGPMTFLTIGESRPLGLWAVFGENPIRQTSYGPYVLTNETRPGHILHGGELGAGTVVRWVGVAADNRLRIYTYGYGPNSNAFFAAVNKPMGNFLFGGIVNPVNKSLYDTIYTNLKLGVGYGKLK